MAKASDLKKGDYLLYNTVVMQVEDCLRRTPANLRAFLQVKLRAIRAGHVAEERFRPDDPVEILSVTTRKMQYLSADGASRVVMDSETFEQMYLPEEFFGQQLKFLKADLPISVLFWGSTPLTVSLPDFVELKVTATAAPTANAGPSRTLKPATLETGAAIQVPLFIKAGDVVKVDSRTEEFVSRVSTGL